jgi:hypothetical protein
MVNCTILASIFAGLPKVDVHLIAYDTQALDLTPWVHDPFETLLRTNLGGGNDGMVAMALAQPKIAEPRNTVVVWISDFYETRVEQLFESMAAIQRSGARFIPVGSVTSSGRGSVNPWFRERFKDLGTPVISGHIRKLVRELKTFLASIAYTPGWRGSGLSATSVSANSACPRGRRSRCRCSSRTATLASTSPDG